MAVKNRLANLSCTRRHHPARTTHRRGPLHRRLIRQHPPAHAQALDLLQPPLRLHPRPRHEAERRHIHLAHRGFPRQRR